jgi:hypothetical protein
LFYRNVGTRAAPNFELGGRLARHPNFPGFAVGAAASRLVDFDGDGDLDLAQFGPTGGPFFFERLPSGHAPRLPLPPWLGLGAAAALLSSAWRRLRVRRHS